MNLRLALVRYPIWTLLLHLSGCGVMCAYEMHNIEHTIAEAKLYATPQRTPSESYMVFPCWGSRQKIVGGTTGSNSRVPRVTQAAINI